MSPAFQDAPSALCWQRRCELAAQKRGRIRMTESGVRKTLLEDRRPDLMPKQFFWPPESIAGDQWNE
jgi:hypothetical protein